MLYWRHWWSVIGATVFASACGGASSPVGPTPPATLAPAVSTAVETAIRDEFRAETTYEGVVADFGALLPFTNVLSAEQRHSASLSRLLANRGLAVPPNPYTVASVPHFTSAADACRAAVTAERDNIALYDRSLLLDLPVDVRQVFQNNRSASLNNHLPAFERCS